MEQQDVLDRVMLRLEARDIPVPRHLSEPARRFLAVAGIAPRNPMPRSSDPAAWKTASDGWNERILPMIEPLLTGLPVHLETRRIGACDVHIATRCLARPPATPMWTSMAAPSCSAAAGFRS
jgi:hypothetical protein